MRAADVLMIAGQAAHVLGEMKSTELGRTGIRISEIGAGTWQWGDRIYWGFGNRYGEPQIEEAYRLLVEEGVSFFDTAEVYGWGRSERVLGGLVRAQGSGAGPVIATKFAPLPWRLTRRQLRRALRGSLRRLGMFSVDLYQVHQPWGPRDSSTWVDEIGALVEDGFVKAVGVSNFGTEKTRAAVEMLERRGTPLASNQVGLSLLNRTPEKTGLLEFCRESHVTVIAYGPLGEGLLTGKYSVESPPPFIRRMRYARKWLPRLPSLLGLMEEISKAHNGASLAQVAINWVRAKGAVPIPGVKSAAQARDVVASTCWDLEPAEVSELDSMTADYRA